MTISMLESDVIPETGVIYSGDLAKHLDMIREFFFKAEMAWSEGDYSEANEYIRNAYTHVGMIRGVGTVEVTASFDEPPIVLVTIKDTTVERATISISGLVGPQVDIIIDKGTKISDSSDRPLRSLSFSSAEILPPTEGMHIIGRAYRFEPEDARFNPPITVVWEYNPTELPEKVDENKLSLAFWNKSTSEWVEMKDSKVDVESHIVTASVNHFTIFAIVSIVPGISLPAWSVHLWWGLGVFGAALTAYLLARRRAYRH